MRNKKLQEFEIHLLSIKNEPKTFEFKLDKTFFKEFEQDVIDKGLLKVEAEVTKTHAMVNVHLYITGNLSFICDRSLEEFEDPFMLDTTLYFKFGPEDCEIDVNLYQIEENTINLNIAHYLMECILVEIPFRRVHPKFRNENDLEDSEEKPFFQTEEEEDNSEKDIDPRWAALKNLKNN